MKKEAVILKGNKAGIRIVLDDKLPFEQLVKEVVKKFQSNADFLGNNKVAIAFDGRDLSEQEEGILLHTIQQYSHLQVVCIIDEDAEREALYERSLQEHLMSLNRNSGQFFKGNLRSGQVMEFETSIIILGDVNVGAQVVSTGNVIVLGNLYGTVYAGASGKEDAFVVATKMNPIQIRISDVIARASDKRQNPSKVPQIAYLKDGAIYMDDLSRMSLTNINV